MDEVTQTSPKSDWNLIIYILLLFIGAWLLEWILEHFTGFSRGTGLWIMMFLFYAAFYPVQTRIRLGKEEPKKKTFRLWIIDAFLWASAFFTLNAAFDYLFPHSN